MDTHDAYLGARLGRRAFVRALGAGPVLALLAPLAARGQTADPVHDLKGDVRINGQPADWKSVIRPGDTVVTGRNGYIVFVVGQDAFMLRERSELKLEGDRATTLANVLRLVTGALGAVFGRGPPRAIYAPTVTAGIRGTGVYLETRGDGTYFCTCYGTVQLTATGDPRDRELIESRRHVPRLIRHRAVDGAWVAPASFETHTDGEMDMLEKCVGRRSPLVVPR